MKKTTLIFGVAAAFLILSGGRSAFAQSSGAWSAFLPSDAPYISRSGVSITNTDTVSSHLVGTGITGLYNANGNTTYTANFYGKNNGQQLRCSFYGVNPFTGATLAATTTNFTNGIFSMALTLTPTFGTSWFFNVTCALPKSNGTQAEIYGHYFQ